MEDQATKKWLDAYKGTSTATTYKSCFKRFLKYVGMTGDEILASRKEDLKSPEIKTQRHWEEKVGEFKRYLKDKYSPNSVSVTFTCVRSFFDFHYSPLRLRKVDSVTDTTRTTSDYKFSKSELHKMSKIGDIIDAYIVTVGKSFGMRASDFIRLTRGHLEPYIDREPPIAIGEYPTQKEKVVAYPFIDPDAREIIKMMLEKMNAEGRIDPTEKMLTFRQPELTTRLKKLAKSIGITNGSKIIRFHNLRKFLCNRLSSIASESKWKQIVGKKSSEGAYVDELGLQEIYERVMPQTCWTTNASNHKKVTEMEVEIKRLKTIIKEMAVSGFKLGKLQLTKEAKEYLFGKEKA